MSQEWYTPGSNASGSSSSSSTPELSGVDEMLYYENSSAWRTAFGDALAIGWLDFMPVKLFGKRAFMGWRSTSYTPTSSEHQWAYVMTPIQIAGYTMGNSAGSGGWQIILLPQYASYNSGAYYTTEVDNTVPTSGTKYYGGYFRAPSGAIWYLSNNSGTLSLQSGTNTTYTVSLSNTTDYVFYQIREMAYGADSTLTSFSMTESSVFYNILKSTIMPQHMGVQYASIDSFEDMCATYAKNSSSVINSRWNCLDGIALKWNTVYNQYQTISTPTTSHVKYMTNYQPIGDCRFYTSPSYGVTFAWCSHGLYLRFDRYSFATEIGKYQSFGNYDATMSIWASIGGNVRVAVNTQNYLGLIWWFGNDFYNFICSIKSGLDTTRKFESLVDEDAPFIQQMGRVTSSTNVSMIDGYQTTMSVYNTTWSSYANLSNFTDEISNLPSTLSGGTDTGTGKISYGMKYSDPMGYCALTKWVSMRISSNPANPLYFCSDANNYIAFNPIISSTTNKVYGAVLLVTRVKGSAWSNAAANSDIFPLVVTANNYNDLVALYGSAFKNLMDSWVVDCFGVLN